MRDVLRPQLSAGSNPARARDYPVKSKQKASSYKRKDLFINIFKLELIAKQCSEVQNMRAIKKKKELAFDKDRLAHTDNNKYLLGAWGVQQDMQNPHLATGRKHLSWMSQAFAVKLGITA